jgi:hypothetical protein
MFSAGACQEQHAFFKWQFHKLTPQTICLTLAMLRELDFYRFNGFRKPTRAEVVVCPLLFCSGSAGSRSFFGTPKNMKVSKRVNVVFMMIRLLGSLKIQRNSIFSKSTRQARVDLEKSGSTRACRSLGTQNILKNV